MAMPGASATRLGTLLQGHLPTAMARRKSRRLQSRCRVPRKTHKTSKIPGDRSKGVSGAQVELDLLLLCSLWLNWRQAREESRDGP